MVLVDHYFTALISTTEPDCLTIIDCNGICGGLSKTDCSGKCNGDAVKDCNGDCLGTAVINNCGYCVEGNTGRSGTFGLDECDKCITSDGSYMKTFDCNGDCDGTAYYDECGQCVGE